MKKASSQNDALLALISTLTVVFIVLFISLAYFANYRVGVLRQEAYANQAVQEMHRTAQMGPVLGTVAGSETSH